MPFSDAFIRFAREAGPHCRLRFAPTPSGYLHIGNALNFCFNWLVARLNGGKILLRIDDIDAERKRPEYVADVFESLEWLGLDYDETTLTYRALDLWTSPVSATTAGLEPRVVRPFPGLRSGALGGHWYATLGDGRTMDVYDLRDGSRRNWDPPEGGNVTDRPLYATSSEILVTTTIGAFRIDPNALPVVEP